MTAEEPGQWTGALFAERYRVGRQLDRGGMGAVYEGVRVDTGVRVAIKILHPHLGEDRYHLTRFQREAEAAAMLGHRHIVRVLDFRSADNEPAYLVMEFLAGNSLSSVVKATGPLEQRRVATIGAQVLSALSAAHAAGIVHRDIKPSNIFLALENGREVAKIVDFGIAKMMEGTGYTRMTATGALVGTPAYMPPEQALGKEVDGRADIYSLGASLFVALTARPPFTAPAFSELIMKILREPAPPIAQFRPDIDPRLDAVIVQSLAKKPEERFQSADAMAHALTPWVASAAMPTMTLPASRQPPDTSDDFDVARTSQLPAFGDRGSTSRDAQVGAAVEPIPPVRGATLATNEPRMSFAHATAGAVSTSAVALPATAPAGARAPGPVARTASVDVGRPSGAAAAPVRSTPAAFEVAAPPAASRRRGTWVIVGGVVVLLGLALGAGGAVLLSRSARPAPTVVDVPSNVVRPVVAVPSAQPAKIDPRKPAGEERHPSTPVVPAVALVGPAPAVARDAHAGELSTEHTRDDEAREDRHASRRAADPPETDAPAGAEDGTLTRVPSPGVTEVSITRDPSDEPSRVQRLTLDVRAETFGAPSPLPGFMRGSELQLAGCRAAATTTGASSFSWLVDVDPSGSVTALHGNDVWPGVALCVEPVLRRASFPGYTRPVTYRATLRLR